MNDSDPNNPKPLPDDFGMTIPNMRLPKQNQGNEADLPTTNLRSAPQPPAQNPYNIPQQPPPPTNDFGMTIPNLRLPNNQPPPAQTPPQTQPPAPVNDFDMTAPNIRPPQQPPSEPDFGITQNNSQTKNAAEPDYGATMSYIPAPAQQRNTRRDEVREGLPPVLPQLQAKPAEKRKGGIPLWAWLLSGGLALIALLSLVIVAVIFLIPHESGFTLVLKGAPAGSTVLVDGTLRGVTSADGSFRILGIEADKKRALKVTHEGFSDFNDTIIGANGETRELIAQMKPTAKVDDPGPVQTKCECPDDPRVCLAECAALDALDKLKVPFTVDQLVAALNLQIINFSSNSSDVPPARKRFLERAAEKFKLLTGKPVVEIGGHTDNVGNDAANLNLSNDRAKAVRGLLVNFGVSPSVLTTRGFGSKKPKTTNDTEDGKFQNRRIEYTVVSR
ncbi:MAG: OmpA family protein [Pyrinomonadaceae bacterium]